MNKKNLLIPFATSFLISGTHSHATTIAFQNATASISQQFYDSFDAIDGSRSLASGQGWATNGATSALAVELANPVSFSSTTYNLRLYQGFGHSAQQFLQNFRVSYTTDGLNTFADGLSNGGDVTANWTPINVFSSITENAPSDITFQVDNVTGDISVTSSNENLLRPESIDDGYYDLQFTLPASGLRIASSQVTGLRIDALSDPGFANGNFILREMVLTAVPEPSTSLLTGLAALALIGRRRR